MDGVGHHEVLIESPKHNADIAVMDQSEILNILKTYKLRIKTLMKLEYIESVICFRNDRAKQELPNPIPIRKSSPCRSYPMTSSTG